MEKTFERPVGTSASSNSRLRYRRKVSMPTEKEPQPPEDKAKHFKLPYEVKQREQLKPFDSRSKSGSSKQQPVVLKQVLWKAKAVQSTPTSLTRPMSKDNEDDLVEVVKETYQTPKLLGNSVDAKRKRIDVRGHESESFVAGSSSQETQSGSEDEVVFLRYSELQPSTKWPMDKVEQDGGEEIDREEPASSEEGVKRQVGVEKTIASHRNQRQQYRWKQKQNRAAAKRHKRLQHQQKQEHELLQSTDDNTGSTQECESATHDRFHPSTNLISGMDAGICRAVLEKVVPFIVVGDVACPVTADSEEQLVGAASTSNQSEASTTGSDVAIVDFRQDVSAMLDRSKEMQVQYRDSFVVDKSGFDAASSYDFFKHRFCKIQKTAAIVYYY